MSSILNSDPKTVFDYIFNLTVPGVKLELSRVVQFMKILGNPYQAYKTIHVAGTNGKGSTSAMLAAIMTALGVKTGLFTSPHLIKPNERVRIGKTLIPDDFIIEKVDAWRPHIETLEITFFEVLTALAMVYFKEQKVEYVVLETGLGGRLDATNVVDPILSVITAISMDHENILGETLEKIALEKAGIIKPGKPLILGQNKPAIQRIMRTRCHETRSVIIEVPRHVQIVEVDSHLNGQLVSLKIQDQTISVNLPLLGSHQVENFSNVLVALSQLGFALDSSIIQEGLDAMHWPGRMQRLHENPTILYDVAHNLGGLQRLMDSLREIKLQDTILIAALNARKNISAMVPFLESWSGPVLYTAFKGHSSLDPESLRRFGMSSERIFNNPAEAYAQALRMLAHPGQVICFLGSHYLAESLFDLFSIE
ncbi:MAG: bifunctional folylpolyglutamate synthase/dihydrofolate synthase [Candidatus Marinimicrobia bacterium]|nr:bifunctional folylpolyglutamate synthase/dihydrofolate synthase [Candidatus Neomarinimicrobiota bacterium]